MEQQGSEINHRGKRGAMAPLPRKFSTILSRLDEFQIQSSGKIHRDFDAILLKFYALNSRERSLSISVFFNDILRARPRTAFILPHIINDEFIFQRILSPTPPFRANLYTRENARFIRFNLLLQQSRKVALMRL